MRRYRAGKQVWQAGFECRYQSPAVAEAPENGTWVAYPWRGDVTVSEGGLFASAVRSYKSGWRVQRLDAAGKLQITTDNYAGQLVEGFPTLEKLHLAPAAGGGVWLYGRKDGSSRGSCAACRTAGAW